MIFKWKWIQFNLHHSSVQWTAALILPNCQECIRTNCNSTSMEINYNQKLLDLEMLEQNTSGICRELQYWFSNRSCKSIISENIFLFHVAVKGAVMVISPLTQQPVWILNCCCHCCLNCHNKYSCKSPINRSSVNVSPWKSVPR